MKRMKKSIFLLSTILLINGCSNDTIDEERTIVLEIDSEVIPQITSNYGNGSYDNISNIYTHNIPSIKDVYITLSYDELKTVTVYIPTSEMNEKTINRKVKFGEELDAEVEITVNGVKTLEGITFDETNEIKNIIIGEKNKFEFTVPSRDKDYNIKFSLPGYREFDMDIKKENLINGIAKLDAIAMNGSQVYLAIDGSDYSYNVYSSLTNQKVASGYKYYENTTREYILLDKNQEYYVEIYDYNDSRNTSKIYKTKLNEDTTITLNGVRQKYLGYLSILKNGIEYNQQYALYNKNNKSLSTSANLYNNLSSMGLIVRDDFYNWVYFDDLSSAVYNLENNNYEFELDYTKAIEVDFHITRIHNFTSQVISSQIEDFNLYLPFDEIEFNNNIFYLTLYENETREFNIDLYDTLGNKVDTIPYYIYSNFYERIISGTIDYNGRKVPYQFPLFKNDINYENGNFTYTGHPIINLQTSIIEIAFIDETGSKQTLNNDAYILDSDGIAIFKTDINDGKTYFQLEENKTYILHNNGQKHEFILIPDKIINGQFLIVDEEVNVVKFKVSGNNNLTISDYDKFFTEKDNEGIVRYYTNESQGNVRVCMNNQITYICLYKDFIANEIIEIGDFYKIKTGDYQDRYSLNYSSFYNDTDDVFYYFDTIHEAISQPITFQYISNGQSMYVSLKESDFIYDDSLNAYVFDFANQADYILTGDTYNIVVDNYYKEELSSTYYLKGNNKVVCDGIEYDLSNYQSKYLHLTTSIDQEGRSILNISEVNE